MSLVPQKNSAVYYLLIANLIPLAGVIFLGWNLFFILFAYWLENIVIGFYTILKILMAEGSLEKLKNNEAFDQVKSVLPRLGQWQRRTPLYLRIPIVIFFIMHFGMFTLVHGLILFGLISQFGDLGVSEFISWSAFLPFATWGTLVMILSFIISHGISFAFNYVGQQEYKMISPSRVMMSPYERVVVMHVVVIFGGFILSGLGANPLSAAIIILLKSGLDFFSHIREHSGRFSSGGK